MYICRVQEEKGEEEAEDIYGGTTDDEKEDTAKKGTAHCSLPDVTWSSSYSLKGHYRGKYSVFWSILLKFLTKNLHT